MTIDSPAERLRQRVLINIGDPAKAITTRDILSLEFNSDIVVDIQNCLTSDDATDLSTGFLFLGSFLEKIQAKEFGTTFMTFLKNRIPALLMHKNSLVRYRALDYFVWLKNNYQDYRNIMLGYLSSSDLGFRKAALNSFETYSLKNEVSPLINLYRDEYASESSMCGPMRYELRDLALEKIESILGKKFRINEVSEPFGGGTVVWYDWGHFLAWWESSKEAFL